MDSTEGVDDDYDPWVLTDGKMVSIGIYIIFINESLFLPLSFFSYSASLFSSYPPIYIYTGTRFVNKRKGPGPSAMGPSLAPPAVQQEERHPTTREESHHNTNIGWPPNQVSVSCTDSSRHVS